MEDFTDEERDAMTERERWLAVSPIWAKPLLLLYGRYPDEIGWPAALLKTLFFAMCVGALIIHFFPDIFAALNPTLLVCLGIAILLHEIYRLCQ